MSRAITLEEARKKFLSHIRGISKYWATVENGNTTQERLDGMAFSILNLLDGGTMFPAMDIVLRPHPDDKKFCQSNGLDWYEDGMVINSDVCLHELWYDNK